MDGNPIGRDEWPAARALQAGRAVHTTIALTGQKRRRRTIEGLRELNAAALPAWRARNSCGDEWVLLRRAFAKLILPHVDEGKLLDAIAGTRFSWSPLVSGTDKPPLGD